MEGLNKFRESFESFSDNYVIIGGAACDIVMTGSRINGAFTVELAEYIEHSDIDYWIYGHSHRNIDKVIGTTHCVCNQFGYAFQMEHYSFDREKVIDIRG